MKKGEEAKQRSEQREKREHEEKEKQAQAERHQQEQTHKQRENAVGKWCNCMTQQNPWHGYGYKLCPNGYLLTGLYRNEQQFLHGVRMHHCCQPCKDDGRTVMSIGTCHNANWWGSFDRAGWSHCPSQTYIQGFLINNCPWIYCLEEARCCQISGSRGSSQCRPQNGWGRSLDMAGWSYLNRDLFMTGLYRSGGHYLFNIEFPMQCNIFAY